MAMNIEVAITLVKQAIDQDKKKNYEEAARCYREGIIIFKTVAQELPKLLKGFLYFKQVLLPYLQHSLLLHHRIMKNQPGKNSAAKGKGKDRLPFSLGGNWLLG